MEEDLATVTVNPLVVVQPTGTGAVLMDVASSECFELNRIGAEVWARLSKGEPPRAIVDALASSYALAPAAVEPDVRQLLADLLRNGLVTRAPAGPAPPPGADAAPQPATARRSPTSFALVECAPASLLIDLASGALFRLNESATFIWRRWLDGEAAPAVADALSKRHGLPLPTAREHVDAALTPDPAGAEPPPPRREFLYQRNNGAGGGYLFSRGGVPVLTVDEQGGALALSRPGSMSAGELFGVLQAVAPKLLALRRHFILHASAVVTGGRIVAFCGASGAGKTTTARSLARAGATPVCEDKLVLVFRGDQIEGLTNGETAILGWAAGAAAELASSGAADCAALDALEAGARIPLAEIGFIEAGRRVGEEIVAQQLTPLDGAVALFGNAFYGSDLPEDWRRQLETAVEVARRLPLSALTMPKGIKALDAAATALVFRSR